jgi:hypothetical protein
MQAEAVGRAVQRGEVALPEGATNQSECGRTRGGGYRHETERYRPWEEGDTRTGTGGGYAICM